jgi:hypothetical protein
MMRVQVQSFQMPRWVIPVLVLAALALIPFALALALVAGGIALTAAVVRALLPPSTPSSPLHTRSEANGRVFDRGNSSVIDADYEVKDENEKK